MGAGGTSTPERSSAADGGSATAGVIANAAEGTIPGGSATAGVLASAAGVATAEIVATLTPLVPSPLDTLGQVVVDTLPGVVVTAAIALLGDANRVVLLALSIVTALLLGALLGRIGARSFPGALTLLSAVAILALLASLSRPEAAFPLVLLTLLLAGVVSGTLLFRLLGYLGAHRGLSSPGAPTPTDPPVDRRAFLRLGVASSVVSVAGTAVARRSGPPPGTTPSPTTPAPTAARPLPAVTAAQDLASSIPEVSPVLTPIEDFFRIDTAVLLPRTDVASWRLRIGGAVERPLTLTYEELTARDLVEVDATIACVSNEVGGSLIGTARWVGVPLRELLDEVRPTAAAEQILSRSVDGFTAGFPLEVAAATEDALVAVGMNGRVLPLEHGYPARLVVPGLFGYVSATKWLADIELTAWDGVYGYWVPRGWSKEGPVKIGSRIEVPAAGGEVAAGTVVVAGVAWAPTRGISRVEVVVADGDTSDAELFDTADSSNAADSTSTAAGDLEVVAAQLVTPLSAATWVQWRAEVPLAAGEHRLLVRAVDGDGVRQARGPAPPAPNGAEGWHTIRIRVV